MIIAIRKEENGNIYIDKEIYSRTRKVKDGQGNITIQPLFSDEELTQPPYNYTNIEIDDKYADCVASDFNDDLSFNIKKYNARKQNKLNNEKIIKLKEKLKELNYDFIQSLAGAVIPDIEAKTIAFKQYHNELRELLGKNPRLYL